MSEILPGLYLGSLKVAQDAAFLTGKKIRLVVSCGIFTTLNKRPGITYLEIPLKDNHARGQITTFATTVIEAIDRARKMGHAVLVHCLKGMSRSATMTTAYVMNSEKLTATQALLFVR